MKPRILLVEDAKELVEVLSARLEANGYEILTALNGQEGLEQAEKNHPDLILLDLGMPEMDGYAMIKELKRRGTCRDIPIIVATGHKHMKDLIELEGVSDFLTKPYGAEDLLNRIAWVLRKHNKA